MVLEPGHPHTKNQVKMAHILKHKMQKYKTPKN